LLPSVFIFVRARARLCGYVFLLFCCFVFFSPNFFCNPFRSSLARGPLFFSIPYKCSFFFFSSFFFCDFIFSIYSPSGGSLSLAPKVFLQRFSSFYLIVIFFFGFLRRVFSLLFHSSPSLSLSQSLALARPWSPCLSLLDSLLGFRLG